MEDILKETGKQVPALVVLVVLTWLFLKQMSESRSEYLASIEVMHKENLEARSLSREAVKENTLVTGHTNECLINMIAAIKALEHELNRTNGHKL